MNSLITITELNSQKRPWCWERLKAGEGDDRGWDGWMASLTQWTWVGASSGSWWWTGRPGMLQSMRSKSWAQLSNWTTATLQIWEQWFTLWPHFSHISKKSCWYFILFSISLFVRIGWRLIISSAGLGTGSPPLTVKSFKFTFFSPWQITCPKTMTMCMENSWHNE